MLNSFLNNKTLFFNKIDYDVISDAWNIVKDHITLPFVIHIVGTNGKGSTGRFLSHFLFQNGYKTLHYSSPHILKFNERIWIDGVDSTDEQLDFTHKKLLNILPKQIVEKLTYFEYATLIALVLSDGLDFLVLEAGLGGEFDATNVVQNDLTLITTIGIDHTEFLGNTIEEIAATKMRSCNNAFILGKQVSNLEVLRAKNEVLNLKEEIPFNNSFLPKEALSLPKYLQNNLKLALRALEYLAHNICTHSGEWAQDWEFKLPVLFGRCQKLTHNITIDVGHNPLAAKVLADEFKGQKIILIYNSYKDKDYKKVLEILKPIIKEVQIIQCDDDRMADENDLIQVCKTLRIAVKKLDKIENDNKYLVFGSFKVVEEFLQYKEASEF